MIDTKAIRARWARCHQCEEGRPHQCDGSKSPPPEDITKLCDEVDRMRQVVEAAKVLNDNHFESDWQPLVDALEDFK